MIRVHGFLVVVGLLWGACVAERSHPAAPPKEPTGVPTPSRVSVARPSVREPAAPPAAQTDTAASPRPSGLVEPLPVPGYADAAFVGPIGDVAFPVPITVVLHGNYDRPEWECHTWRAVAAHRGFVVCPRGVSVDDPDPHADRWTYRGGAAAVATEIRACLDALDAAWPGMATREGMVLAGFSLGANLAPRIAVDHPGMFEALFLVEGGVRQLEGQLPALRRAGVVAVGLAMATPDLRQLGKAALQRLRRAGFSAALVDMAGAGHNYRDDFGVTGHRAFTAILDGDSGVADVKSLNSPR